MEYSFQIVNKLWSHIRSAFICSADAMSWYVIFPVRVMSLVQCGNKKGDFAFYWMFMHDFACRLEVMGS
jgi:hypothetical protein